jgi:hypothetical protein
MYAIGIGSKLALFGATRDTSMPLDADGDTFHEDALTIPVELELELDSDDIESYWEAMKVSNVYQASEAAHALVGEDWLKESRSALGLAKAQDRSSRRPKL